jgi:ABC-type multidrug transport system fused ATPase/permease subunit
MTIASERIVANLRKTVFAKIMKQDISFFDMRKTGELVNRLSSDTTMMGRTLVDNMAQGLRRIVEGIGGLGGKKSIDILPSTDLMASSVVFES